MQQPLLTRPPQAPIGEVRIFVTTLKSSEDFQTLFSLLIGAVRVKRENVIVQSPTSISKAPSTMGHTRGSVLALWLLSLLGTLPYFHPCSSPVPPLQRRAEHKVSVHFLQHCCKQMTTHPPAPIQLYIIKQQGPECLKPLRGQCKLHPYKAPDPQPKLTH